jgi:uncharacterized membrane protein YfcA
MVLVVFSLIYIAILAFIFGTAATSFLRRLFQDSVEVQAAIVNITGLIVLAVIAGYLSMVIKVGLLANVFVTLFAIIILLLYRIELRRQFSVFSRTPPG